MFSKPPPPTPPPQLKSDVNFSAINGVELFMGSLLSFVHVATSEDICCGEKSSGHSTFLPVATLYLAIAGVGRDLCALLGNWGFHFWEHIKEHQNHTASL